MSTFVQQQINNRNRWVYFTKYRWTAHVVYWTWVLVAGTLMMVTVPITPAVILNHFVLSNINIAIFYYLYCLFLIPYFFKRNKNLQFWVILTISFVALTAFDVYFNQHYVHLSNGEGLQSKTGFWTNYLRVVFGYVFNFLLFTMMLFFMEKNEENSLILEMEKEKKDIELVKLDLLKTNISPDFLLRSLNQLKRAAISGEEDTPESIITLSELIRYRLYRGKQLETPLAEEIEALQSFIKFIGYDHANNNTCVKLGITGSPEGKFVAALALINIIEPFCKVIPLAPTVLRLHLLIEQNLLELKMDYNKTASGQLLEDLNNYGHNYKLLYGKSVNFNFENCAGDTCKINLTLPLL
jgi:two-component system LytT family sensor kinase